MADTFGILVSSNKHLDYVVALVTAAHAKGKETQVLFSPLKKKEGEALLLEIANILNNKS